VPTVAARPPAPTSTPTIQVEAVDFNAYRLVSGWTFVQGFVQNTGSASAGSIEILVSLIADGDTVVGSAGAHIEPGMLKPGSHAPWLAQFQRPPSFAQVRVQVQARPFDDFLQARVTQDFQLEDVAVSPPADQASSPTIVGEVRNSGSTPVTDVRVTAAIFDGEDALFQVARATVDQVELAPGQRVPFEIRPIGRGLKEIPRYELFAEGRPTS